MKVRSHTYSLMKAHLNIDLLGRVLKPRTWREHASISIPLLDFSRINKDFSLVLQVMWFGVAFGTLGIDKYLNSNA